jgi:hypothetical protein
MLMNDKIPSWYCIRIYCWHYEDITDRYFTNSRPAIPCLISSPYRIPPPIRATHAQLLIIGALYLLSYAHTSQWPILAVKYYNTSSATTGSQRYKRWAFSKFSRAGLWYYRFPLISYCYFITRREEMIPDLRTLQRHLQSPAPPFHRYRHRLRDF